MYRQTKWILNLNFSRLRSFRFLRFFASISFRTHTYFRLLFIDSNSFRSTKMKSTKMKKIGKILLSSSIIASSFLLLCFFCIAFRFWLYVPKHNVFFCYRLKVNFLHYFFSFLLFPHRRLHWRALLHRTKNVRNMPRCIRIYNIVDSIFLRTRTVKLNERDMLRTGFCVRFFLASRFCHAENCTQHNWTEQRLTFKM